jgi:hypothetical protein
MESDRRVGSWGCASAHPKMLSRLSRSAEVESSPVGWPVAGSARRTNRGIDRRRVRGRIRGTSGGGSVISGASGGTAGASGALAPLSAGASGASLEEGVGTAATAPSSQLGASALAGLAALGGMLPSATVGIVALLVLGLRLNGLSTFGVRPVAGEVDETKWESSHSASSMLSSGCERGEREREALSPAARCETTGEGFDALWDAWSPFVAVGRGGGGGRCGAGTAEGGGSPQEGVGALGGVGPLASGVRLRLQLIISLR